MVERVGSEKWLRLVSAGYWISILYFVVISISLITEGDLAEQPLSFAVVTPMFLLFYFFRYLGLSGAGKDERLARIAGRAMAISWFLAMLTLAVLVALSSTPYISLNVTQVLGIVLMVMVATMAISNEALKRKGDAD